VAPAKEETRRSPRAVVGCTSVSPSFISGKRVSFRVLLIRVVLRTTDLVSIKIRSSFRCRSRRGRVRASTRGNGNMIAESFSISSSIPLDSIRRCLAGFRASPAFGLSRTIELPALDLHLSLSVENVESIEGGFFRDRARRLPHRSASWLRSSRFHCHKVER